MLEYISPNMPECMGNSDSESINRAVRLASESGVGKVIIPRINARTGKALWDIDSAILIPSDMYILLDNCFIRQADGCFDNVFRTANTYADGFSTLEKEHRNIHIEGVGNAIIDGGVHNGLTEKTSQKDGNPHIIVNNMILMHNVDGFVIENIKFTNQRWWAINLIYATNGRLEDLTFDAKDDYPNQDGIDLRCGCHNVSIRNVFGQAGDDLVALSGFMGFEKRLGFIVEEKNIDIFNVTINNVVGTSVSKAVVALRNQDGIKLHDIDIDGIIDTSDDDRGNRPYAVLRVGQKTYTNVRFSEMGETCRIHAKNIHAAHGDAVFVNLTLCDSGFENVYCGKDARTAFSTRSDWNRVPCGATIKNVRVSGIYCDSESDVEMPLIELQKFHDFDGVENLSFENIFKSNNKKTVCSDFDIGYTVDI